MKAFIDEHRAVYGVEPICKVLPIAPSTYYLHAARQADPSRRSARTLLDERLREPIQQVWNDHFQVYGARKVTPIAARRRQCGPLHGGAADATEWFARRRAR